MSASGGALGIKDPISDTKTVKLSPYTKTYVDADGVKHEIVAMIARTDEEYAAALKSIDDMVKLAQDNNIKRVQEFMNSKNRPPPSKTAAGFKNTLRASKVLPNGLIDETVKAMKELKLLSFD